MSNRIIIDIGDNLSYMVRTEVDTPNGNPLTIEERIINWQYNKIRNLEAYKPKSDSKAIIEMLNNPIPSKYEESNEDKIDQTLREWNNLYCPNIIISIDGYGKGFTIFQISVNKKIPKDSILKFKRNTLVKVTSDPIVIGNHMYQIDCKFMEGDGTEEILSGVYDGFIIIPPDLHKFGMDIINEYLNKQSL